MGEKWRLSDVTNHLLVSDDPALQAFALPGNEYSLCAYLNALETDKAALLEALEEWVAAKEASEGRSFMNTKSMGDSMRLSYAEEALVALRLTINLK